MAPQHAPTLTPRDEELLVASWLCFTPETLPKPDMEELAKRARYANAASARAAFRVLMIKVRALIAARERGEDDEKRNLDGDGGEESQTADQDGVINRSSNSCGASGGGSKKKGKRAAVAPPPKLGDMASRASNSTLPSGGAGSSSPAGKFQGFYVHRDLDDGEETLLPSAAGPKAHEFVERYYADLERERSNREDSFTGEDDLDMDMDGEDDGN